MTIVQMSAFDPSKFTEETLRTIAADLKSGRVPLKRLEVTDDIVAGLRAVLLADGSITYHAPSGALGSGNAGASDYVTTREARRRARL